MKTSHMFVFANTSKEAVGKITDYFGEEYVESFSVSAFSPDDFLMVDGKDYNLFTKFRNCVADDIVW